MAGRFLFRELSSRIMSRSATASHLRARASAGEPATCRPWEGSISRTLHSFLHSFPSGPAAHHSTVAPNRPGIHCHVARYFNTLPCTRTAANIGSPTSGVSSDVSSKPAVVNSVGVKRAFSSSTSTADTVTLKPKVPTSPAEWEAKWAAEEAASEAKMADWIAKKHAEDAAFLRYTRIILGSWCLMFISYFWTTLFGSSHGGGTNGRLGQSGLHCCLSCCCCKCRSGDSES